MNDRGRLWHLDLAAVVIATACAGIAVYAGDGVLRIALGLPLVVLLPGYALVSLLFPARSADPETDPFDGDKTGLRTPLPKRHGIDGYERLGLSVALSVAIVPAVAFVADFTAAGIALEPILAGVCGVTVALALLALATRSRLPPERRVGVPRRYVRSPRSAFGSSGSPLDSAGGRGLDVALAAAVLLFVGSVGVALASPAPQDGYTEFYVETENVTGDTTELHPAAFAPGESRPLTVGIGNREGADAGYTIVAELGRVDGNGSNATIREERELLRADARVADGETRFESLTVRPTMTGERLRLRLTLYRGGAPADASAGSAYRTLTLWIDVGGDATADGNGGGGGSGNTAVGGNGGTAGSGNAADDGDVGDGD